MIWSAGNFVKEDTSIYLYRYDKMGSYTLRIELKKYPYKLENLHLAYDPIDGLWATARVRSFWKRYPHKHPHATLFGILYHNTNSR